MGEHIQRSFNAAIAKFTGSCPKLAPARFSIVKVEQIAWLKQREASTSIPEQSKMTVQRIQALQDLLW